MDAQRLIDAIRAEFPDDSFRIPGSDGALASVDSPHPDVGTLAIFDDGDEYTLQLGRFTHCHFDPADDAGDDPEGQVVHEIVDLMRGILNDEIEMFGNKSGTAGGFRARRGKPRPFWSRWLPGRRTFVWSGPIEDRE